MINTWTILSKELAIHNIKLVGQNTCIVYQDGKPNKTSIDNAVKVLGRRIDVNIKTLNNIWSEMADFIYGCCSKIKIDFYSNNESKNIDPKLCNLFVSTSKELYLLASLLYNQSKICRAYFLEKDILRRLKRLLQCDYKKLPIEIFDALVDYKIAIDWVMRKNCQLQYVCDLLVFSQKGRENVAQYVIKVARGISGPWANLDLPMLERVFEWSEIEEETRGRQQDKQRQRRYRKGFENYNNDGRVGNGHYWRELRNEPYSWYDREDNSPYPSRSILSK